MKIILIGAAAVALVAAQVAPALAQATADERQDRGQMLRDDSQAQKDSAYGRKLNAERRSVELRLKHDRGAARAADEKQLARLNQQIAGNRSRISGLMANDHSELKDYRQDMSQGRSHATTPDRDRGHDMNGTRSTTDRDDNGSPHH